ncbi:MAG TPA: ATP-binding protein [Methylomirabilota bacterium]|nr:ATP-binding protein [Methylomirabilota bacterium]
MPQITEQQAGAEAMFASIGDGAITTDEYGRITRVNPVAQELLGFTEAELIGEWFPKIIVAVNFDDSTIALLDRPITKTFLTGKPVVAKLNYRHKNGHNVPVSITASPIIFEDKPLGCIEVIRDITLEQEIDRMKSEFISLASHQLRTPLSAVKTYTHMLADGYMGKLNPAQKQSLATIISASNRMNELISTLLNITRIESGTIAVTPKSFKLDSAIEDLMPELGLMAKDKSIKLSFVTRDSYSTSLKTDSLIFKEIVTNLVSNAIKYTPRSGTVTITLKPRRADIMIEVSDTGWGIPKYSQDQVFSKFFRADNIIKRETTGTGLGLYLVKGLIGALNGKIWFTSEEGSGTHFFFSLPRQHRQPAKPK